MAQFAGQRHNMVGGSMDVPKAQSTQASPADRRRERRTVEMRGYIIRDGGVSHGIEVTDLNYGGCGIDVPIELKPGETLKLSVLGRGCIPAEVRWYHEGKAGLDFEPAERASRKRVDRRTARIDVPGEVGLRSVGRNGYRVRVFDLSTDGCKIELVERPNVGDQMLVKFDGIEVLNADVCWVEGPAAGLMFENRLHPAVLDLLLQRLGAG
jgi:hypothetical protein